MDPIIPEYTLLPPEIWNHVFLWTPEELFKLRRVCRLFNGCILNLARDLNNKRGVFAFPEGCELSAIIRAKQIASLKTAVSTLTTFPNYEDPGPFLDGRICSGEGSTFYLPRLTGILRNTKQIARYDLVTKQATAILSLNENPYHLDTLDGKPVSIMCEENKFFLHDLRTGTVINEFLAIREMRNGRYFLNKDSFVFVDESVRNRCGISIVGLTNRESHYLQLNGAETIYDARPIGDEYVFAALFSAPPPNYPPKSEEKPFDPHNIILVRYNLNTKEISSDPIHGDWSLNLFDNIKVLNRDTVVTNGHKIVNLEQVIDGDIHAIDVGSLWTLKISPNGQMVLQETATRKVIKSFATGLTNCRYIKHVDQEIAVTISLAKIIQVWDLIHECCLRTETIVTEGIIPSYNIVAGGGKVFIKQELVGRNPLLHVLNLSLEKRVVAPVPQEGLWATTKRTYRWLTSWG